MNRCGCDSWFKSFQTGELKKIEITRTESKLYCKLNLKHKMKVNDVEVLKQSLRDFYKWDACKFGH